MTGQLKITLAQINPIVGDVSGNIDQIISVWDEHDNAADLIAFSELCLCGYPPDDLVLKPSFIDHIEQKLNTLIALSQEHSSAILVSCPSGYQGELYNAAHIIYNGIIIGTVYKHILPNYGVFDDKRIFQSGELSFPIPFKGCNLGILICEDLWASEPAHHLKEQGADYLIAINASPFTATKYATRLNIARQRVEKTGLPLAYVNQVGGHDELVFDGGSFLMDARGDVVAQAPFFENYALNSDAEQSERVISAIPTKHEAIYNALVLGLRDYVHKNGFKRVILGVSGGIDSAVVACIAADAVGANNVLGVLLPSSYTSDDSNDDALSLIKNLGIAHDTIAISDAHDVMRGTLDSYLTQDDTGLTDQNLQSRLRGITLMGISNATGRLLLSTGNKSEMAVGYATLYGDMNGAFNPIKDVYKTDVYKIGSWLNETRGDIIPPQILTKAPTAELKEDQTDQDSLPPYDILDGILSGLIENEASIDDLVADGFDRAVVTDVQRMLDRSEYKRRQAPPGPKVTSKAFGRDRRYPITNGFLKSIDRK